MDNKLIMAGGCIFDQCVRPGFIVVKAEMTPAKPDTPCIGVHDLGTGFVSLTLVGHERVFRTDQFHEEVVARYHLRARENGGSDV